MSKANPDQKGFFAYYDPKNPGLVEFYIILNKQQKKKIKEDKLRNIVCDVVREEIRYNELLKSESEDYEL